MQFAEQLHVGSLEFYSIGNFFIVRHFFLCLLLDFLQCVVSMCQGQACVMTFGQGILLLNNLSSLQGETVLFSSLGNIKLLENVYSFLK